MKIYCLVLFFLILLSNLAIQGMEQEKCFSEQEYELYVAQRKLADLIFALGKQMHDNIGTNRDKPVIDRRHQQVNPSQNRVSQGIFLELYYGYPYNMWSPFGKWNFLGVSKLSKSFKRALLVELSTHVVMEVYREEGRRWPDIHYGPIYIIKKIGDSELPEAQEGINHTNLEEIEIVRKKWQAMKEQYDWKSKAKVFE